MNILMMTNTYTPHVGGVARSVKFFADEYRALGHRVLVVAPEFEGAPEHEPDVVRMPAIQKFNGSDFSVVLPISGDLDERLEHFKPAIVHAHHPFLIGSTALRVAAQYQLPLVFTHHTMYEQYTHYVPGDSPALQRFAIELAVGYCNLCTAIVAPSESVARILIERGVTQPIASIPTGVHIDEYAQGDRAAGRSRLGLPQDELVVGHLGRLAPEKNLPFLARAVARFIGEQGGEGKAEGEGKRRTNFLVVGTGPSEQEIRNIFAEAGLEARLHFAGKLQGRELVEAYKAMDVFAFASHSETQGMVLAEAMAAGVPVVAVDAPGAREVVRSGENGELIPEDDEAAFAAALARVLGDGHAELARQARQTAEGFSMRLCAERMLELYDELVQEDLLRNPPDTPIWEAALGRIRAEWDLVANVAQAAFAALGDDDETETDPDQVNKAEQAE